MAPGDPRTEEPERYRALFEAIDQGFCIVEAIVDERGAIVDLVFREANRAFARQTGISNVVGRSASELFPAFGPDRFAIYSKILETGEAVRAERSAHDGAQHYNCFFARIGGPGSRLVAIVFDDVTERTRAEERLSFQADLLANTSEALIAADEQEIITFWNAAAEQLFGWRAAEVIGRTSSEVLQRDVAASNRTQAQGAYEEEAVYRKRDGELVSCDVRARAMRSPSGEYRGTLRAFRDATQRKHVEQTLRDSEARQAFMLKLSDALRPLGDASAIQREASRILREQLGAVSVVYWEIGPGGATALAENALPEGPPFLGATFPLEQYGVSVAQFLANRALSCSDIASSDEFSADEKAAYVVIRVNAWAVAPLVKDGKLLGVLGAYFQTRHDWTAEELVLLQETAERTWAAVERASTAAALRQREWHARQLLAEATNARAQAEAANQAKDEFLATLSHELRTPLAAILLWAGALRSGAVALHDMARAIDAIVQSAESQARLIEDLLDLSRLTSGKLVLAQSVVSIDAVVRAAVDVVRPAAEAKGVLLRYDAREPLGKTILDGARVQQVLWNLLTNATKFTPAGGVVALHVRKRKAQLEIEVSDTGEGIAPEFMPHVFEKFRQADMGEAREHMGLGIGLALSRQLVELHGGTIEAESEGRGTGAVFRVRLPWTQVPDDLDSSSSVAGARSGLPLETISVLLVEDDANTREGMRWTLTAAGARVLAVATAVDALEALGLISDPDVPPSAVRAEPDVIVSDLGLPGMNGYELIRRIVDACRRRGRPSPPACAISAHARDADRKRAIESGFDLYIPKPVAPDQLIQAVVDLRDVLSTQVDVPS
ncbi:MAG TPA: ATP-binding protein [Polyangiales bacterium]|nr:ATP-binding protein [Polyangiales bacterium]